MSDVGLHVPVGFGLVASVLHYSKAWLLFSRSLQSSYKEKIDIFLELGTNSNYGTLICYHASSIKLQMFVVKEYSLVV